MAFVNIEDETKTSEAVIMPRQYEPNKEALKAGALVLIEGRKEKEESILANKLTFIDLDEFV